MPPDTDNHINILTVGKLCEMLACLPLDTEMSFYQGTDGSMPTITHKITYGLSSVRHTATLAYSIKV